MKKRLFQSSSLYLLLFLVAFGWYGCKKDDAEPAKTAPTGLTTSAATNITPTGATISGNVAANGGETLLSKGVVYSKTNTTPNLTDDVIGLASGTDLGTFSVTLTGLDGGTKYYARAFATNSLGITYGSVVEFTTAAAVGEPSVSTTALSGRTNTGVSTGGAVSDAGGSGQTVTDWGIVWSTNATPTLGNGTKVVATGPQTLFTVSLSGLTSGTKIYLRAYATNSPGNKTGYGQILSYIPPPSSVTATSRTYNTVIIGDQVWFTKNLNENSYRGGTPLIGEATTAAQWLAASNATTPQVRFIADANSEITGGYYNYYAVADPRNLCPTGWKVPSYEDFDKLINFLGGPVNAAGGKLKSTSSLWAAPNTGANNSSGFSAEPSGWINNTTGNRDQFGTSGYFWTKTESGTLKAKYIELYHNSTNVSIGGDQPKGGGYSVRCIMEQ